MAIPQRSVQGYPDPACTWIDVTPELAAEWLKRNTLNRPKKTGRIKIYARDMREGCWPITGAPLQFGKSGRLLDGQNRLQAVIDSGITTRFLVVEGVDDTVFDVIDGGARRTASDVLVIEGYEGWVAKTGATAAQVAINLSARMMPYWQTASPQAVRRFINDHPGLMDSVQFLQGLPRKPIPLPHSAAAALHFYMVQIDPYLADTYMQQLFRGDGLSAEDSVLKLRNALLARTNSSKDLRTSNCAAVIKVWNSKRAGRGIVHISNAFLRSDEPFPVIK